MPLSPNMPEDIMQEHMARYLFALQKLSGGYVLDIACSSGYGSDLLLEKSDFVMCKWTKGKLLPVEK